MSKKPWTFITNHAAVLTLLSGANNLTARKIATALNITTRTVYRIIHDLESEGFLRVEKAGRENRYTIDQTLPLRHKNQREVQVKDLLQAIQK